jgi:hypothetical protein
MKVKKSMSIPSHTSPTIRRHRIPGIEQWPYQADFEQLEHLLFS